jgi:hypothetical protein
MACGSTTNLGRAVAADLGLMARTGYGPAALEAANTYRLRLRRDREQYEFDGPDGRVPMRDLYPDGSPW